MAASQRVQSRVPAPQRSIVPSVPGLPAGAAVLIAAACTFLGFLIDARGDSDDLAGTFAGLYVFGCVVAVLVVRYRGVFTTMVLPPLLLTIAVPLAYLDLAGRGDGAKDLIFNLGIPLVQRFPTMALATGIVLAIGGIRIFLHRREAVADRSRKTRQGDRWGRTPSKKRPPRSSESLTDSARRRTRRPKPDVADLETDTHLPKPKRRPTAQVADAPPRVASAARPAETRPTRGTRGGAPRPDRDAPGAAPVRRRPDGPPPHPQPNVRYRERDSGRTERRRPENL